VEAECELRGGGEGAEGMTLLHLSAPARLGQKVIRRAGGELFSGQLTSKTKV
jgi:hypothetical protein